MRCSGFMNSNVLAAALVASTVGSMAMGGVITVTNTSDAGVGSLRAAITQANSQPGADVIEFSIPQADPGFVDAAIDFWRISVTSKPLPTLTESVLVDGWTQRDPAAPGAPIIEIDGSALATGNGLELQAAAITVRGLTIVGFPGSGIVISGADALGCWVHGCHVGVDPLGLTAKPNELDGIVVANSAGQNVIGTNGDGVNDAEEHSLISGNLGAGIRMQNTRIDTSVSNRIAGCWIGPDITGLSALGNQSGGVVLQAAERTIIGTNSNGNIFDANERNLISGNIGNGITIGGVPQTGSTVSGNWIGTDITGVAPLPNTGHGVHVQDSPSVGEHRVGMGLGPDSAPQQANKISFNGLVGVLVTGGLNTAILGNSIYDNGELGIDLAPGGVRGVTPNDLLDQDIGPNDLQNFPNVIEVTADGTVRFVLNSKPQRTYWVEFYLNRLPDPSELGEGQVFLGGQIEITNATGSTGEQIFMFNPNDFPDLVWVTATATELPPGALRVGGPTALIGNTSEFSVAIPLNLPPEALPQVVNTPRNTDVTITLQGTDPEMMPLTAIITSLPDRGTLLEFGSLTPILLVPTTLTDPQNRVIFRPLPNEIGSPYTTFDFRMTDGMTPSLPATVTINVLDDNRPPVAVNDSYSTNEDTALVVPAATGVLSNDTDPDLDVLTAVLVAGPSNAAAFALNANGSFSYTPLANFNGPDSFTYMAQDPDGLLSNIATATINVLPVNDPPIAVSDIFNINEDTTLNPPAPGILGNDTDIDGGPLTAQLVTGPSNAAAFALNPNGSFTYTPTSNFNGVDSFTYRAFDGQALSNIATVTINIAPLNDAPVAVNDSYTTNEDVSLVVPQLTGVLANDSDVDGDDLEAVLVMGPANSAAFALSLNGSFTYTPALNFNGVDSFTYRARDPGGTLSNLATVTINVLPINDAPVANDDNYATDEDVTLVVPAGGGVLANDTDVDPNPLTAVLSTGPTNAAAFNLNADGSFTYTPAADFNGNDSFTYRAFDGTAFSNIATARIVVNPVNDPPVARCRDVTIDARMECPPSFFLTIDDIDNGSSDPEDGLSITRVASFLGPFPMGQTPVTLTVTDSGGLSDSCVAIVTVLALDCQPNGIPDSCENGDGSFDCNDNFIPDECECFWDNGMPPMDGTAANGQLSHLGGGAPLGGKAADDFYLRPGEIHRIYGFTGFMLSSSFSQLRRARLEFHNDCNGVPDDEPFATFTNSVVVGVTPSLNGFDVVTYMFDLCDAHLWLEGGKSYWVSLYGITDGQMNDLSFWAVDEASGPHALAGKPPQKADGQVTGVWGEYDFLPWESAVECCIGCKNLAFKIRGESCKVLWDNGEPDLGAGIGGSPSGANRSRTSRTADNFIVPPCEDVEVCLIQAWIWTNCDPVHGFIELYENDCKFPAETLLHTAVPSRAIATGESVVIENVTYQGYLLELESPGWFLEEGRNYWISAGARSTGNFSTRSFFANAAAPCSISCLSPRISPGVKRDIAPNVTPWELTTRDYAFRIAIRQPPELLPANEPDGTPPAGCVADSDGSGATEVADIFFFLSSWFDGCP